MSILADILNVGTGGVISGLLGNALTSFSNIKLQKLKNEHEVNMVKAETDAMLAETKANIQITETKVQGDLAISDNQIYKEAITQEGKRSISNELLAKLFDSKWTAWLGSILVLFLGIVDVLKAAIRPGLTYYFVFITSWLTWMAYNIVSQTGEVMSTQQAYNLFDNLTNNIIYLTVTCVIWWFADRRNAKFQYRLSDGNIRN